MSYFYQVPNLHKYVQQNLSFRVNDDTYVDDCMYLRLYGRFDIIYIDRVMKIFDYNSERIPLILIGIKCNIFVPKKIKQRKVIDFKRVEFESKIFCSVSIAA